MPNLPISGLPAGTTIAGTEPFPSVQSPGGVATTVKLLASDVKTYTNNAPTFTGQALFADGTAALPSIAHAGDTNCGFYFGTDIIYASTGGTNRLTLDGSGKLGLGTLTPQGPLSVVTTGNNYGIAIGDSGSVTGKMLQLGYYQTADYGYIEAVQPGVGYKNLIINPNGGAVSIGTSASFGVLTISQDSVNLEIANTLANGCSFLSYNRTTPGYKPFNFRASTITFSPNDVGKFIIDSSGLVGMGTTTTSAALGQLNLSAPTNTTWGTLNATTSGYAYVTLSSAGSAIGYIGQANALIGGGSGTDLAMRSVNNTCFSANGVERMRIVGSTGNVGIGTGSSLTSPSGVLDVGGTFYISSSKFAASATGNNIHYSGSTGLAFSNNAGTSTRMYMTDAGLFGINTVLPSSELSVNGTITVKKSDTAAGNILGDTGKTVTGGGAAVQILTGTYPVGAIGIISGGVVGVNAFADVICWVYSGPITVIQATNIVGSPGARTYTAAAGQLSVAIAGSGTYNVGGYAISASGA